MNLTSKILCVKRQPCHVVHLLCQMISSDSWQKETRDIHSYVPLNGYMRSTYLLVSMWDSCDPAFRRHLVIWVNKWDPGSSSECESQMDFATDRRCINIGKLLYLREPIFKVIPEFLVIEITLHCLFVSKNNFQILLLFVTHILWSLFPMGKTARYSITRMSNVFYMHSFLKNVSCWTDWS